MRIERDTAGLSVFLGPQVTVGQLFIRGLALPGWIVLALGCVYTWWGLAWAGPAMVFVGLGLLLSVPLTMEDAPADIGDHLRIDHLGVRVGTHRLTPAARVEVLAHGVKIHDRRSHFLPVADEADRAELAALVTSAIRGARDHAETGRVPRSLQALVERSQR